MEPQQQPSKSRVVKVESEDSWELLTAQANNQGSPVLVHFTASWCVPSLAMNSYFEELAMNYQDIQCLVVDVDEVKEIAAKYEVKAMPTFVLMRGNEVIDRVVGANPDEIRKRVEAFVPSFRPTDVTVE